MSEEYDMQFDNLHTLENFLDIYNNSGEMVVTEAIANSLDVNADKIDIKIGKNSDGKHIIIFEDNGPGMNREQFNDYHIGAKPTKVKGKGIGFAGIGAKVYLAVDDSVQIWTETCCGNDVLASVMYRKGRQIKWRRRTPTTKKKRGTLYKVLLNNQDYDYLIQNLEKIIIEFFHNALINGLKITINKKVVTPWKPEIIKEKTGVLTVKGRKLPFRFILSNDEVPFDRRNIEYHVKGKRITVRKPKFYLDVKPEQQNKFYVSINTIGISDYLKTDKVSFKNGYIGYVNWEVDKEILKIIKSLGLLDEQKPTKYETSALTRAFENLFKDPEFMWLNPDAEGIKTPIKIDPAPLDESTIATFADITIKDEEKDSENKEKTDNLNKQNKNVSNSRNRKGFSIMWIDDPGKSDGWLDPATNMPTINLGHKLYRQVEKSIPARNYHVTKTVIMILVNFGAAKKSLTVNEAFELQTKLLTKLCGAVWI